MKKGLFLIFSALLLISFVSGALEVGIEGVIGIDLNTVQTTSTSMNISTNFTNFTQLLDTPSSYSGESGKCTAVNGAENALEFVTCGTGGDANLTNVAFTNQSNSFEDNQSTDSWWIGLFDITTNFLSNYVFGSFNGDTLNIDFNETNLNKTIDSRIEVSQAIFLPENILNITGIGTGNVSDIQIIDDGLNYTLEEETGTPGFLLEINFTDVSEFSNIQLHYIYTGSLGHTINVELFNYQTLNYDSFGILESNGGIFKLGNFQVVSDDDYKNDTNVSLRLNHISAGNINHDLIVDYAVLQRISQPTRDHGSLTGLSDDDHTQYLLIDGTRNVTGNLIINENVTAEYYFGDGSQLTGISGGNGTSYNQTCDSGDFLNEILPNGSASCGTPAGGGGDANLTNVAFVNESNVFTEEQNIKNDLVVGDNTSATYRSLKFTRSSASDYFNEDATFTLGFRKVFFDSSLELNKQSAQSSAVVNAAPTYLSLNCHIDRAVGKSAYCDSTIDYSLVLTFNETVEIRYSTSGINDGLYTVNSSSFNGTTTNITLNEAIPLTIPGFELGYIADQDLGVTGGAFVAEPMLRNGNSGKGAIFSGYGGIEGTNWGRLGAVSVAGNFFGNKGASLSGTDGNINTFTSVGARYYSAAAFGGTFNLYKQISLLIEYTTTGSGTINVNDSAEGIRITNYPTNGHTVNLPKQIQMFIEKPTRGDVNYGIVINGTGREASISFGGENQSVLYSDSNNNVTWDTNLYLTGTGSFEEIIDRTDPPNETEDGRLLDHFNNLDDLENMTDEELHLNLAGGFCENRTDFDRPVKVPVYKEICYGEINQTLLDYYNQTFGLNTLNQEQQKHLRDSMVKKCEMGWDEEITYPYNFTSCGYLLNKEVLNNHFAIGEYRQATDIQETLNNESALVGNIVVANQFVTNTTKDTETFDKLQTLRDELSSRTFQEIFNLVLDGEGKLSDPFLNYFDLIDDTGLGSYDVAGISHFSMALNVLLMKENIENKKEMDMMKEDLCSLGVTRWC